MSQTASDTSRLVPIRNAMNKDQVLWLSRQKLEELLPLIPRNTSTRKLCLSAVAWFRHLWAEWPERHRQLAVRAELWADGLWTDFVDFDPGWLTWHDQLIRKLALRMYDHGAFAELPVLGDALEEAGCCDRHILMHCRGPGPHVRGC